MTPVNQLMLSLSQDHPEKIEQSKLAGLFSVACQIGLKLFLLVAGLTLGGILGLIIGVFSGLIAFSC